MSLQQLSDRFEIRALIVRYSNALDARRFELLDEIFTPDAYIDYRATGGIDGRYPQIRSWLPPAVTDGSLTPRQSMAWLWQRPHPDRSSWCCSSSASWPAGIIRPA